MRLTMTYGQSRLDMEADDERVMAVRQGPAALAPEEVTAAVRAALDAPLDFPPLRRAVVPGDRVVIALDTGYAGLHLVLPPILDQFIEAGVNPGDLTLLAGLPSVSSAHRLLANVRPDLPSGVRLEVHDPAEPHRMSYLASTSGGRRIYLNRTVIDADLVLPVGRLGYDPVLGYRRAVSGVFPGLSDERSQQQYRARINGAAGAAEDLSSPHEVDEVGWLLGIQAVVQVIAGQGQGISQVLAGTVPAVQAAGNRLLDATWKVVLDRRADLVVAAITGDPAHQTIDDLAAGLAAAQRAVRRGGQIVLLCDLAPELGPGARRLGRSETPGEALVQLHRDLPPDTVSTFQMASAADWAHVYLLSGLPDDVVENLFMVPIGRGSEVQRLIGLAGSCVFLADAQAILPVIEDEDS